MASLDQSAFVEDSGRTEAVASAFFYTLGDILGGTDTMRRNMAVNGVPTDVAASVDGTVYVRGTTQQLGTNQVNQAGFVITPTMLLIAAGLWFLAKKA